MNMRLHPRLILRTPAFSHQQYTALSLADVCRSPWFRAAILVASRSLAEELVRKEFDPEKMEARHRQTLQKYLNRICLRPTPFGLFSSFTTVEWSESPAILRFNTGLPEVHCEPARAIDLRLGARISGKLLKTGTLSCNGSIYRIGREFRFYRTHRTAEAVRSTFTLESLDSSTVVQRVYTHCQKPVAYTTIERLVRNLAGCTAEEAAAFVAELITRQFLVSEFEPGITGENYTSRLLREARIRGVEDDETRQVNDTLTQLAGVIPSYARLIAAERHLKSFLPFTHSRGLYYVVTERKTNAGAGLAKEHQRRLLKGLEVLDRLFVDYNRRDDLEIFRDEFATKFGDRVVPFMVAIDPQAGISYGSTGKEDDAGGLLETVPFGPAEKTANALAWSPVHRLLMKCWTTGCDPIRLRPADLETLAPAPSRPRDPSGFPVLFKLNPDQLLIEQAGGTSPGTLSGRFTLFSPELEAMNLELAAGEEAANPDVIFAEVIHYCEDHVDNINRRTQIYRHEIPICCRSERAEEDKVALSDLYLAHRQGELILYSARLKKRVIPRHSSAFNYLRTNLSAFRLLCDLQRQGVRVNYTLNLAGLFPGLAFYPRVECEDCVLHLATWTVPGKEIPGPDTTDEKLLQAFRKLSGKHHLPRFFTVNEHDNQLIFDGHKAEDIRMLISVARPDKDLLIKEFFYHDPGFVQDETGSGYMAQFQAVVVNPERVYQPYTFNLEQPQIRRNFAPGSDWLYIKIYCHSGQSNALISNALRKVARRIPGTPWFFIRYVDPGYHLRLRIQSAGNSDGLLQLVHSCLRNEIDQGQVRLVVDTYEREVERYLPELIEDVEQFFWTDSELVSTWIAHRGTAAGDGELLFALYTVSSIIQAVFPEAADAQQFCDSRAQAFFQEHGAGKEVKLGLNQRFRAARQTIAQVLNDRRYLSRQRLGGKTDRVCGLVLALFNAANTGDQARKLLGDLLHMHMNRIFTDDSRNRELACYHFLAKHLVSRLKRSV